MIYTNENETKNQNKTDTISHLLSRSLLREEEEEEEEDGDKERAYHLFIYHHFSMMMMIRFVLYFLFVTFDSNLFFVLKFSNFFLSQSIQLMTIV